MDDTMFDRLARLARAGAERALLADALARLDARYALARKASREPELEAILGEFIGRLERAFGSLSGVRGKRILDIASGSNSSRSPTTGKRTALFEPWFARLVLELGAEPVAVAAISRASVSSTIAPISVGPARSTSSPMHRSMGCRTVASSDRPNSGRRIRGGAITIECERRSRARRGVF